MTAYYLGALFIFALCDTMIWKSRKDKAQLSSGVEINL